MGRSLSAKLVYGVFVNCEDEEFENVSDVEIEEWHLKKTGFMPSFYPYTEEGEYKPELESMNEEQRGVVIGKYYDEKRGFLKQQPVLIEEHYTGVDGYLSYIYSLNDSVLVSCDWWGEVEISLEKKKQIEEADQSLLRQFCEDHGIEFKPAWHLCALYW